MKEHRIGNIPADVPAAFRLWELAIRSGSLAHAWVSYSLIRESSQSGHCDSGSVL